MTYLSLPPVQIMKQLGKPHDEVTIRSLLADIDFNNDGTINFDEFLLIMQKKQNTAEIEEDLREAFRSFDRDGNGLISVAEIKFIMTTLGELTEDEVNDMIQYSDTDGDGYIDYEGKKRRR